MTSKGLPDQPWRNILLKVVGAKVAWVIVEVYIFVVTSVLLPGYALSLGLAPYLDQGEHSK